MKIITKDDLLKNFEEFIENTEYVLQKGEPLYSYYNCRRFLDYLLDDYFKQFMKDIQE